MTFVGGGWQVSFPSVASPSPSLGSTLSDLRVTLEVRARG